MQPSFCGSTPQRLRAITQCKFPDGYAAPKWRHVDNLTVTPTLCGSIVPRVQNATTKSPVGLGVWQSDRSALPLHWACKIQDAPEFSRQTERCGVFCCINGLAARTPNIVAIRHSFLLSCRSRPTGMGRLEPELLAQDRLLLPRAGRGNARQTNGNLRCLARLEIARESRTASALLATATMARPPACIASIVLTAVGRSNLRYNSKVSTTKFIGVSSSFSNSTL